MKTNRKLVACCLSLVVGGLLVASTAQAATIPSKITRFTPEKPEKVLSVRGKGWRDPAFGDMGWTHSSAWGAFSAPKGATVTIKLVVADKGIHPGITVWYRGKDDTAPNKYVVDHFYPQSASFVKFNATDDTSGEKIGNIVMRHVYHAYDKDGNRARVSDLHPKRDGEPGQLEVSFQVPFRGAYQFVVGGFNPNDGVDNDLHDVDTTVTVTPAP